jgi:hypothetical protein
MEQIRPVATLVLPFIDREHASGELLGPKWHSQYIKKVSRFWDTKKLLAKMLSPMQDAPGFGELLSTALGTVTVVQPACPVHRADRVPAVVPVDSVQAAKPADFFLRAEDTNTLMFDESLRNNPRAQDILRRLEAGPRTYSGGLKQGGGIDIVSY